MEHYGIIIGAILLLQNLLVVGFLSVTILWLQAKVES